MKISQQKLKRIIKEEIQKTIKEQDWKQRIRQRQKGVFDELENELENVPETRPRVPVPKRKPAPVPKRRAPARTPKTSVSRGAPAGIKISNTRMDGNFVVVTVEKDGKTAEGRHEVRSARRMNLARKAAYLEATNNWVRKYMKKQR
jgi:hypothetical protein